MTRVTNFGRKRTYLEAGFANNAQVETAPPPQEETIPIEVPVVQESEATDEAAPPPKKKRKRTKKSKRADLNGGLTVKEIENEDVTGVEEVSGEIVEGSESVEVKETALKETTQPAAKPSKKKEKAKEKRPKLTRAAATELRRQERIAERAAGTTCFACREKGHAARDCPKSRENSGKDGAASIVGICYRCGSKQHTLSRCRKPVDQANPLPFASCFVCSGKGHLASACPQNKAKGIYPNGGCCKLCGETTHLAKDCGLRRKDVVGTTEVLGTGRDAGADEDDFHTFKRRKTEVERDEKHEDKLKRLLDVKTGAHSGVVKPFGNVSSTSAKKKVVYF